MSSVDLVLDARASTGEGPVWDARRGELVWIDIPAATVHRFQPTTGSDRSRRFAAPVGVAAPAADGDLILGIGRMLCWLPDEHADPVTLARLPSGDRSNDGRCDAKGRFLVGTLRHDGRSQRCGLYRLDERDALVPVIPGVTLSNGLDWSPTGDTLYHVDTPTEFVNLDEASVSGYY